MKGSIARRPTATGPHFRTAGCHEGFDYRRVSNQKSRTPAQRVPITCTVCRKVVGYFPDNNVARRKVLFTVCERCQTPSAATHAPRDASGP